LTEALLHHWSKILEPRPAVAPAAIPKSSDDLTVARKPIAIPPDAAFACRQIAIQFPLVASAMYPIATPAKPAVFE